MDKALAGILALAFIVSLFGVSHLLVDDEALNGFILQDLAQGRYPEFHDHPPAIVASLFIFMHAKNAAHALGVELPIRLLLLRRKNQLKKRGL